MLVSDHEIETFWRPEDGEDWLPAVIRAQQTQTGADGVRGPGDWFGFTLRFGARTYRFSGPIPLFRGMRLVGAGSGPYGGTHLLFDLHLGSDPTVPGPPARGIVVHSRETAWHAGYRGDAYRAVIEKMWIEGSDANWRYTPQIPVYEGGDGIAAHTRVVLRDVGVSGFRRDAVRIAATSQRPAPVPDGADGTRPWNYELDIDRRAPLPEVPWGNANFWSLRDVRVVHCGRHSLHVQGPDANAGVAELLDAADNGGWGVLDESFLGNTYLTCGVHHSGHQLVAGVAPDDPAIRDPAVPLDPAWVWPGWLTPLPAASTRHFNHINIYAAPDRTIRSYRATYHRIDQSEEPRVNVVPAEPGAPGEGGLLFALFTGALTAGGYYAVHVEATDDHDNRVDSVIVVRVDGKDGGPYKTRGGVCYSTFLGCYAEGDQAPSQLPVPTQLIGGLHAPDVQGTGFTLLGDGLGPHHVPAHVDTPHGRRRGEMILGDRDGYGRHLHLVGERGVPESYLRFENKSFPNWPYQQGWYGFNYALADRYWMLRFPMNNLTTRLLAGTPPVEKQPRMTAAFPAEGFYLGHTWFGYAAGGGEPTEGTWDQHDIVLNPECAEPGHDWTGWLGAVCTQAGTSGTYREACTGTADGTDTFILEGPAPANTELRVGDFLILTEVESGVAREVANSRIVAIDTTGPVTITMQESIRSTRAGLVISHRQPQWRRFGRLEDPTTIDHTRQPDGDRLS